MLNEEVLDSLQKVTINLVFYGDNITISIKRDMPIEIIYRTAYDYFKPHGKIKLYYKNKELTPFFNYTIGKYFKKLKNIDILVKDSSRMDNTFDNQLLLNSDFNFEHLNKFNSNNALLSSKSISKSLINKNKGNLPQNQRAMTFCWDCKKFPINIFCRDCGAFVCKYCRMDSENVHYSHRTVTLYPENLAKSANLYKNILIEDLNEVEKINMNRNKINEERQQINVDIERKKNHLVIKINRLINKINQIKSYQKEIDYYINNKDKCKQKLNKAITSINTISNEYTQQYPTTLTENITTKTKNNVKDLKEIFSKMNSIEKSTEKICKIGKTIQEWEEINTKLENALKNVEDRIYTIIEEAAEGIELISENEVEIEESDNNGKDINNKEIKDINDIKNDELKKDKTIKLIQIIESEKKEKENDNDLNNKENKDENEEEKGDKEELNLKEEKKASEEKKDDDNEEYEYEEVEVEVEEEEEDDQEQDK